MNCGLGNGQVDQQFSDADSASVLGPWTHVGSRMQILSAARIGDELTTRAEVTGNDEKKGHRFVELDALVLANGKTPLAHCWHTAIYQPRERAT